MSLANIKRDYDEPMLAAVRQRLAKITDQELFEFDYPELSNVPNQAVAHVLLERGLLPGRGCIVANIHLTKVRATRPSNALRTGRGR